MKNQIQVYGLQRSGTNFLEWTLKNNFFVHYDSTKGGIANAVGDERYGGPQSLKHLLPNLENGKALIIQRDYEEWAASIKKTIPKCSYTKEDYEYYYNTPTRENFDDNDYLILNHKWCVLNYKDMLELISYRFKIKYKKDWVQPMYRMNWDGGNTMLNIPFKL